MLKAFLLTAIVTGGLITHGRALAQPARDRTDAAAHHVIAQHEHDHAHPRLVVGFDTVTGFGNATFVALPEAAAQAPEAAQAEVETAEVVTGSLIVGGAYELAEHLGVGARVPIVLGQWQDRSETVLGNVEIETEYGVALSPRAYLRAGLGVALPVAQGRELPHEHDLPAADIDQAALREYDRGALLKAAVASRGLEDEALFEVDHLGIVPKLSLDLRNEHFLLGPFTRLENLFDTGGGESMFEWLVGSYAGWMLSQYVDVGARAFADVVLAGPSHSAFVVEPQLTAHLGQLRAVLGGIWPLLGSASLRNFVGVRALISMRL